MAYNPSLYMPQAAMNNIIPVTGMNGAMAYPMPPNSRAVVFDDSQDVMYFITTDGGGYKTIQDFDFFPRQKKDIQKPDYVSRAEFEKLAAIVSKYEGKEAQGDEQFVSKRERKQHSNGDKPAQQNG